MKFLRAFFLNSSGFLINIEKVNPGVTLAQYGEDLRANSLFALSPDSNVGQYAHSWIDHMTRIRRTEGGGGSASYY